MLYWESPETARELRAKVVVLMDENGIASTPPNYELCFHYELNQTPDLRQAMDEAIRSGRVADPSFVKELHAKFCRGDDSEIEQSASLLEAQLRQFAVLLQSAGQGSSDYGRTLKLAAAQLGGASVPQQLSALIGVVKSATNLMIDNTSDLEVRVAASTKEIEKLRAKVESVRKESLVDTLTGLANRRSFDEHFAAAVDDAKASGTPLCILMCDIDRFKRFNDTWGHATGDQVLRLVAQCISSNVKGRDTAARYGGEELVVILPRTGIADATAIAEQIRRTVESRKIIKKSTGETYGSITLSIGIAEFKEGESADALLRRADACMYAAKSAGRNRVCSHLPSENGRSCAGPDVSKTDGRDLGESVLELAFNDQQTEIFVDPSCSVVAPQLQRLKVWWSVAAQSGMPLWRDSYLDDMSAMRDILHVYQVLDEGSDFRLHWAGAGLIGILGENATGFRMSEVRATVPTLAPSVARTFELARLALSMKTPVRSSSKGAHVFSAGRFRGESLYLPFEAVTDQGVGFILAASVFTPVSASF